MPDRRPISVAVFLTKPKKNRIVPPEALHADKTWDDYKPPKKGAGG